MASSFVKLAQLPVAEKVPTAQIRHSRLPTIRSEIGLERSRCGKLGCCRSSLSDTCTYLPAKSRFALLRTAAEEDELRRAAWSLARDIRSGSPADSLNIAERASATTMRL